MKNLTQHSIQLLCTLLLICLITPPSADAQRWTDYYQRTPFLFAPASSFQSGLLGYTNPALTQSEENDLRFLWNTNGRDATSIRDWGIFTGGRGFGFNVLRRRGDEIAATDYRINLGFGDRAMAGGLAYQWTGGDESAFGLLNHLSTGFVYRPAKFISAGLVGNFPTRQRTWETVGEIGIRPFGDPRFTIFADGALRKGQALVDMPWSVGASSEVIPGVDLVGRYLSGESFTVGLTVNFGRVGAGSQLHFTPEHSSSTQLVRAGQFMPNFFSQRFRSGSKYTSMELQGPVDYREPPFAGIFGRDAPRFYEILEIIDTSADDDRVEAIALNLSGMEVLPEHAWEIRTALERAQAADKTVIIYIDNAEMDTYHLASAADYLVMDPMGTLLLPGYLSNRTYFAGTLEKLGLGFDAWRYLEYKSAAETFSRDDMSDADREQLQAFVDDQYELVQSEVHASRPITLGQFDRIIDNRTLLRAEEAREVGLVDTLARWNDLDEIMEATVGSEKSNLPTDLLLQDAKVTRLWQAPAKIGLVYGLGVTAMEQGIHARRLHENIRKLGEDDDIRAIVFRVDSPGGDALASDLVAEALREAAEQKPVIVSQGQVAASGGYWISMYGDTIMAGPNTVTGSIGVIGGWLYDEGFSSRLGMSSDHVQRGEHADVTAGISLPLLELRVPTRNLTEEEQNRVQEHILGLYDTFVEKVSEGRSMEEERVREVAEGRIYSGRDGQEAGLVDLIGGLSDAVEQAKTAAGIPEDHLIQIVEVGQRGELFQLLPFGSRSTDAEMSIDPVRDYLQLFLEHQPRPLVIIEPGTYPWYMGTRK